jgi:outer membrane protein assembly factor BamD
VTVPRGRAKSAPVRAVRYALLLAVLLCAACASVQKTGSYAEDARLEYEHAMEAFEKQDCIAAEPLFKKIRANYPYTRYAALSELREADCLALQDKHAEAIEIYQRFAKVHASHESVPYARFMAAKSQVEQIPSEWFLAPPSYERDLRAARDALKDLRRFLLDFPSDGHAGEATAMERRVLELLAKHELYVAEFYLKREQPSAAVVRLQNMLGTYDGSGLEAQAMLLMGRTQLMLKDRTSAHSTFRELIARYPKSGSAVQAERFLAETGG